MLAHAGRSVHFSEPQKPLPSLKRFARGELAVFPAAFSPGPRSERFVG